MVTPEPGKDSKNTEERILSHSHNDSIYDTLDNSYPSLGLSFLNGIRDYIAAPMFCDLCFFNFKLQIESFRRENIQGYDVVGISWLNHISLSQLEQY